MYSFPIKALFLIMNFDAYATGKHTGFKGSDSYLIGYCGMTSFSCMEPVTNPSAATFALGVMKMLLQYGFCHTVVLNKDSKFFGVGREVLDLLQIDCHILSSANHNPMLIKHINCYLNKRLRIMCNKHNSVWVALEAILLFLYAWSSCPVPGTNIPCSLVAVGHKFAFLIDFLCGKHWELTLTPNTFISYPKELAMRLSACRKVAAYLVEEQLTYHHELINT
jgi:hypothetical protein